MADSRELSGIVLSREPAGDRFLRVRIFDHLTGLSAALFPHAGKRSQNANPPDLFDRVDCVLKPTSSDSSIPFVAEFHRVHSCRELASNPQAFITASEIARFYLFNGAHLIDPSPHFRTLCSSLDSFQRAKVPKVVLFKLYYCFARDEGLPVRESWLADLPVNFANEICTVLKSPVDGMIIEKSKINEILESLKMWMNAETELRVE